MNCLDISILSSSIGQQASNQRKPTVAAPKTAANVNKTNHAINMSDDIEIVGEIAHHQSTNNPAQSDESRLRSHLAKTYASASTTVNVAAKPQSNFINNVVCLNRLMARGDGTKKSELYGNKLLRRYRPYSVLRASAIVSALDRDLDDENNKNEENDGDTELTSKKIIIIDDSNEEIHKPWITPELIKLIKQRNLLQAKLNESKGADSLVNEELIKKFKNLRNKVFNCYYINMTKSNSCSTCFQFVLYEYLFTLCHTHLVW